MKFALFFISLFGLSFAQNEVAVLIGGLGGGNSVEVVTKDGICGIPPDESVPQIPNAPAGNLDGWVAEYVDGNIYLCGGQDLNDHSECYPVMPGDSNWGGACSMSNTRENAASVVINGQMVVTGGYNDRQAYLDGIEYKAQGACEWSKMGYTLQRKMFNHCAVTLDDTRIIVIGGQEYASPPEVDAVSILNVNDGTWEDKTPLPSPRTDMGCVKTTLDGKEGILVAGGCVEFCSVHLADTLFYDINADSWTQLADLNVARFGHQIAIVGGVPTAIGGYGDENLGSIEEFNGQEWTMRAGGLRFPRYSYGMARMTEDEITCP